ncbi:MAG: septum formation initiator family protein [Bacteriovoracaceae bacterium]|nr:septum formation initiator family protein [Bacteriovoracaceae bacterium]
METEYQGSSIASERLRKAIERNRLKQAKRQRQQQSNPIELTRPDMGGGDGVWSMPANTMHIEPHAPRRTYRPQEDNYFTTSDAGIGGSSISSALPAKRFSMAVDKVRQLGPQLQKKFLLFSWLVCGLLGLRLLFADRGVVDYYRELGHLAKQQKTLQEYQQKNLVLAQEVKRLKTDEKYQRKMVRDHLGHVAHDEFVVAFTKE